MQACHVNGFGERGSCEPDHIGDTLLEADPGSIEVGRPGKRNTAPRFHQDCLGTHWVEPWRKSCHNDCVADQDASASFLAPDHRFDYRRMEVVSIDDEARHEIVVGQLIPDIVGMSLK